MNNKFKLTDKVTKESIRSPEFKRWLMRTLAVVCILSLVFQFSTCVYLGLNAYAADEPAEGGGSVDSIRGTWVFNDTLTVLQLGTHYNIDFECDGSFYTRLIFPRGTGTLDKGCYGTSRDAFAKTVYDFSDEKWSKDVYKTITITGGDDISDDTFIAWLNVNASKLPPPIVYDFTNEIRVFNDDLTFFITDSTTWTEAFNFNFEVIGVGTADYIVLQRDVNNNYTMSYSYDFDDSGGLRTVYRFNHTTDTGGFFKENTKYIRFISNPENTDFQQWLLDNTTLVGTSDDSESFDTFYDMGFNVGYNAGYEQGFANSLIGDALSGPINALSSITLIQIGDTVITLGGVIMTAIALCLVLAFLKLYAGG